MTRELLHVMIVFNAFMPVCTQTYATLRIDSASYWSDILVLFVWRKFSTICLHGILVQSLTQEQR